MTTGGPVLIDVRPAARIAVEDREAFAATAEAALAAGWRYLVVPGWRPQVMAGVDALSAQRRPVTDLLGVAAALLSAAEPDGTAFAELAGRCSWPAVGRALLIHLLWHRRLGVDLSRPLSDRSAVWPAL